MSPRAAAPLPAFSTACLPPGTRLGLAVSGGADSVALLLLAALLAGRNGWQLRVLQVDHGLREASESDAAWVRALAGGLGLPSEVHRAALGGLTAGIEEAARAARYRWFKSVLADGGLDAVATGHTLDDQAETVLARLLRGAWTGGLGGIYPVVRAVELPGPPSAGVVVRPLLRTRREELRAWLRGQGQDWREDETNADPRFTRNRIRAELLPALAAYNPQVPEQLAQMSELAREDENYWQAEVARLLPALVLPGRAVRGGGRASSTVPGEGSLAIEAARLQAFAPALQRRLLRAAAAELGSALDFAETARVLALLGGPAGSAPRREQLTAELRAERTARELRFVREPAGSKASQPEALAVPVPGEVSGLGVALRIGCTGSEPAPPATLRPARSGDRVRLRHSSGAPKRVKEVLERLGIAPPDRAGWPVLEWQGEIVWLRGAQLEPTPLNRTIEVTEESPPPANP